MTRALDARVSKLERQAKRSALSYLTDAELNALIIDLGDLLAADEDDPTSIPRTGTAADALTTDEEASAIGAWRIWRVHLVGSAGSSMRSQ